MAGVVSLFLPCILTVFFYRSISGYVSGPALQGWSVLVEGIQGGPANGMPNPVHIFLPKCGEASKVHPLLALGTSRVQRTKPCDLLRPRASQLHSFASPPVVLRLVGWNGQDRPPSQLSSPQHAVRTSNRFDKSLSSLTTESRILQGGEENGAF